LGLAIAREIASRHGAAITLTPSSSLGGLKAGVRFPALAADDQGGQPLSRVA
jgi:signal transduction histidine kinase